MTAPDPIFVDSRLARLYDTFDDDRGDLDLYLGIAERSFVFETRVPARQAWLGWTRERRSARRHIPGVGQVEMWSDLLEVALPLVTFQQSYRFPPGMLRDGDVVTSVSTLRFPERDEIEASLAAVGFEVDEVLDAPDRPGLEWVFVARRP